ncbi:hypothetical protein JTB14_003864 [Gonioctena quinquepunctata]|nr:hypothetical protein JTB14_003864 [Gonioctena quinquepunctata]
MLMNSGENTSIGVMKKFYHIAAVELAWKEDEAATCKDQQFREKLNNVGVSTGRLIYNPIVMKTRPVGSQRCADDKLLTKINIIQETAIKTD